MNIKASMKMAFAAIKANKMRTLLTMLGIIIGISSVIALVTLGNGNKAMMTKEFSNYGANRAMIYVGSMYEDEDSNVDYSAYNITAEDIKMVRRIYGDKLEGISPVESFNGSLVKGKMTYKINFSAVNETYQNIENMSIVQGRFFNQRDIANESQQVVIDQKMAQNYFGNENPLGQMILVDVNGQTEPFRVIGVFSKAAAAMERTTGNTFSVYTVLPIGTRINEMDSFGNIELNIKKDENVKSTVESIASILEKKHDVVGKKYYQVQTMKSQMKMMNKFTGTITTFVAAIAGISLIVGGIGIMNIMLVSVTERTREIGIRKAIGAKKRDILSQFMIESVIVSGIGGIIGIVLGIGFALVGTQFMNVPLAIDVKIVFVAFFFSALIGIFFGIYPANKAANLNTIDALRYE
ncbi:ABC transporter permease [Fusibacter ferrireducens]|uniref:ABC transporter permease n=1 Tax=Fusibacter ferrireducens TaxID=2785058 RepID=A0ABR9ZXS0_9FIRM|nr:ABC transporter permease [Fusibacter ferrireducens]MBF4694665.1 ABC transporter permease [Fusibacter ferrireducens]